MTFSDVPIVIRKLRHEYQKHRAPIVDLIEAQTRDPFKVLLATILSARTQDGTTAKAAARLFRHVQSAADLNRLSTRQIEKLIFPVGFYHTKAAHLKKLPDALEKEFQGILPQTVEELCKLPGVGRKTANLVVAVGFSKPAICVDVHVHRIANRLGLLQTKTPLETEMTLREKLPTRYWKRWNVYFVSFGQTRCRPIRPRCNGCPIFTFCDRIGVPQYLHNRTAI